ncbi:hypothetical protein BamMC406_5467 [Burkholderia ambifaria MC40-6]|uniref:Uncharacterized protein n=1 Tax=Burkholderia ambifaria (strain MC40-6) TaxID=398577 RepID=B1Z2E9_BURA4|nr:hypothetical protein BamMC406_5467 [Burkholderia ambifaria MC40-6]
MQLSFYLVTTGRTIFKIGIGFFRKFNWYTDVWIRTYTR